MTRTDVKFPELKAKIDDLNDALKIRNLQWSDAERSFIIQMKTRVHFSERQIEWIEALWYRI